MDWRTKGVVTPIKDQGQCVAATEGITKLTTSKLISILEQELVDCDVHDEDQGCNDGLMDDAFEFIIKNKGLVAKSNYPYKATDSTCNTQKSSPNAASIDGYEDVPTVTMAREEEEEEEEEVEQFDFVFISLATTLFACISRLLVCQYLDNGNLDKWFHGDIGEVRTDPEKSFLPLWQMTAAELEKGFTVSRTNLWMPIT
ncbi:cysteine protease 1 [Canna indica]|uniref:Cysteine protease 1 n=1 Tax=Canna indica TaxID=4628 RepID=A0AAQ3JWT8_9LILI|nr:cysteine protease 1 [Canna indica]